MNKLVSVIIPTYNDQLTINKAVDSALNQTYLNVEIIIIDDGSTDSTSIILKKFYENIDKITVITQSNSGVATARNNGLAISKGEYTLFGCR